MVTIRVFYSPQCPAVFPSLGRLREMASRHGCRFESSNVYKEGFAACEGLSAAEELLLAELRAGQRAKYFFARTFVDGEAMPGFPPPLAAIEARVCELLGTPQESPPPTVGECHKARLHLDPDQLRIRPVTPQDFDSVCALCLELHPSVCQGDYRPDELTAGREGKGRYLASVLREEGFAGLVAYAGEAPAGMVEVLPPDVARRIGVPCSAPEHSWVIPCLTVRAEYQGQGVGRRLVEALVDQARLRGWRQLEVLARPGGHTPWDAWQAAPFYRRMGFRPVEETADRAGGPMVLPL